MPILKGEITIHSFGLQLRNLIYHPLYKIIREGLRTRVKFPLDCLKSPTFIWGGDLSPSLVWGTPRPSSSAIN